MSEEVSLTAADARRMAELAALPLGADRAAAVAAVLNAWLPAANELSRKMSEASHWTVTPVTTLAHPAKPGGK